MFPVTPQNNTNRIIDTNMAHTSVWANLIFKSFAEGFIDLNYEIFRHMGLANLRIQNTSSHFYFMFSITLQKVSSEIPPIFRYAEFAMDMVLTLF